MGNGIFRRTFSSSCSRRVASDKPSRDVAIRGHHDWGTGVFAHPRRSLFSTASELLIIHSSWSFNWPIERHFQTNMHLLHNQWCPSLSSNGSALASEDPHRSDIWGCIQYTFNRADNYKSSVYTLETWCCWRPKDSLLACLRAKISCRRWNFYLERQQVCQNDQKLGFCGLSKSRSRA